MKILILADGRSPITLNWLRSLKSLNHQIVLVSSYPCEQPKEADEFFILPVAFSGLSGSSIPKNKAKDGSKSEGSDWTFIRRFRPLLINFRYILGPFSLPLTARKFNRIVSQTNPDLIHALRIPYEGMLLSFYRGSIPCAVSIWGNDITLHAQGSAMMRQLTQKTLKKVRGLAADTKRDIRLGKNWGFPTDEPALVVPGNGGIDFTKVRITAEKEQVGLNWLPENWNIVINPRGFRPGSVRNDTFFQSIPLILRQFPNTLFLCCSMAGQPEADAWLDELQIHRNTMLLPTIPQELLWSLFSRAQVTVSISEHDGTPNSLLEAMTCGCFPVAGDIESIREWITPGVNGLLVDPNNPEQLASAVISALLNEKLRSDAAEINRQIILERADSEIVRTEIEVFYNQFVSD